MSMELVYGGWVTLTLIAWCLFLSGFVTGYWIEHKKTGFYNMKRLHREWGNGVKKE